MFGTLPPRSKCSVEFALSLERRLLSASNKLPSAANCRLLSCRASAVALARTRSRLVPGMPGKSGSDNATPKSKLAATRQLTTLAEAVISSAAPATVRRLKKLLDPPVTSPPPKKSSAAGRPAGAAPPSSRSSSPTAPGTAHDPGLQVLREAALPGHAHQAAQTVEDAHALQHLEVKPLQKVLLNESLQKSLTSKKASSKVLVMPHCYNRTDIAMLEKLVKRNKLRVQYYVSPDNVPLIAMSKLPLGERFPGLGRPMEPELLEKLLMQRDAQLEDAPAISAPPQAKKKVDKSQWNDKIQKLLLKSKGRVERFAVRGNFSFEERCALRDLATSLRCKSAFVKGTDGEDVMVVAAPGFLPLAADGSVPPGAFEAAEGREPPQIRELQIEGPLNKTAFQKEHLNQLSRGLELILRGVLTEGDNKWLHKIAKSHALNLAQYAGADGTTTPFLVLSRRELPDPHPQHGQRLGDITGGVDATPTGLLVRQLVMQMQQLVDSPDQVELEFKEEFSDSVLKRVMAHAEALDLYSMTYMKGSILVISKQPLPVYRPQYDPSFSPFPVAVSRNTERLLSQFSWNSAKASAQRAQDEWDARATLGQDEGEDAEDEDEDGDVVQFLRERQTRDAKQQQPKVAYPQLSPHAAQRLSKTLQAMQRRNTATAAVRESLQRRSQLPACAMRGPLLDAVQRNQVLLVSGETGCGKSTQLPQMVLEDAIEAQQGGSVNIVCTQPRRISAISLARRVASERGERVGDVVGYQVRMDSATSGNTRLTYCTTGVLLRQLMADPTLSGVTHVVIDEIHERHMGEDFLITLLRDLLPQRPDLRLVLMSATLNAELFQEYFGGCERIHIPGFTFPVETKFLEDVLQETGYALPTEQAARTMQAATSQAAGNRRRADEKARQERMAAAVRQVKEFDWHLGYTFSEADFQGYSPSAVQGVRNWMNYREDKINMNLIEAVLAHICAKQPPGAVLVFLPGWDDITQLNLRLQANPLTGNASQVKVLPLHGNLPLNQQQEIFDRPPPGVRKIVLATNIAESSITVDDVVYVVDAGKAKEKAYDAVNQLATLLPDWISKASAKQRRGRAGRVQAGVCYHLYPRPMFERHFQEHQVPELLRTPLAELALQVKALGLGDVAGFLQKAVTPPEPTAVANAVEYLQTIGAMDGEQELTPLGEALATLPMEPAMGKMVLLASLLGTLDPALIMAATMAGRGPFLNAHSAREEARAAHAAFSGTTNSDHLGMARAYEAWQAIKFQAGEYKALHFCQRNFLHHQSMQLISDLRLQFAQLLAEIGFLGHPRADEAHSGKMRRWWLNEDLLQQAIQAHSANSGEEELVRALLVAATYPNVALVRRVLDDRPKARASPWRILTLQDGRVRPHPGSILDDRKAPVWLPYRWLACHDKVKTSQIYLRSCTPVSDAALLLFGGQAVLERPHVLKLGQHLTFTLKPQVATGLLALRAELDRLLQHKLEDSSLGVHPEAAILVATVAQVLRNESGPLYPPPEGYQLPRLQAFAQPEPQHGYGPSAAAGRLRPGPGPAPVPLWQGSPGHWQEDWDGLVQRQHPGMPAIPAFRSREPFPDEVPRRGERQAFQDEMQRRGERQPFQDEMQRRGERQPFQDETPRRGERQPFQDETPRRGERQQWQQQRQVSSRAAPAGGWQAGPGMHATLAPPEIAEEKEERDDGQRWY